MELICGFNYSYENYICWCAFNHATHRFKVEILQKMR